MKKTYTPKQKASIALSALRGEQLSKLGSLHQIHPVQIGKWKKTIETEAEQLFSDKRKKANHDKDRIIDELYETIGRREMEISWLKKKFNLELPREIGFH
jgi:putative transposase